MTNLSILFVAIISIYDADTFRIKLPCDFPVVCDSMPIRATGFDAPEMKGKCPEEKSKAKEARKYVNNILSKASKIELRNLRPDKYFRLLADVWVDGKPLADLIISKGLARRYAGETRTGWCPVKPTPTTLP